jgi:hypothetical protein
MRRMEKMEVEKEEAKRAAKVRSTCEECGKYGHVQEDCPEEAKVIDYMWKGELPKFRYMQVKPQSNASSSIQNLIPLRIQLKDFMDKHAKITKDIVTSRLLTKYWRI